MTDASDRRSQRAGSPAKGGPRPSSPGSPRPGASTRGAISPFIVMDVMRAANERAAAGGDVLHLEVGQPGTPAPAAVLDGARRALATERLGYTDALGLETLRRRIARHYGDVYGLDLDWRRVVVTTGSSGAFVLAFLAAFEAGDRVALASPGYPAYRNILKALGVDVLSIPVDAGSNFQPTPDLIEGACPPGTEPSRAGLAGLIVASPANPTGTMLDRPDLSALTSLCAERGLWLVSDEIYHGITYEAPAVSALSLSDDAIVVNSFSKYFSMTGWRVGWMVVPDRLLRTVECLAQNLFISPPAISQHAAVAALDCRSALDEIVSRYAMNRRLLLAGLPEAGFGDLAAAQGAFYLYADVGRMTNDSEALCRRMLTEIGVAATPGIDFDPERGHRFMRFSFAGSTAEIEEAVRRLASWHR